MDMDNLVFSQEDVSGGSAIQPHRGTQDEEILAMLDHKIDQAIESGDIDIVIEEIAMLRRATRIMGISLVRLLGRIAENWDKFGINEDVREYLFAETGLNKATVDRYIKVYEMLKIAPEEYRPRLQAMNVKNLIPVGNALAQGFALEENDWENIAGSQDYNEVAALVREIKGTNPRRSGTRMWCDRSGAVYAFVNIDEHTEEKRFICTLPVDDDDPIVQRAVERILKNAGIRSEWEV